MYKQYGPVRKCIYCGESRESLSKEHIIPYALGGNLVLPRASCATHRDLTSAIEGRVAQQMYGRYRDILGVQTRHPQRKESRKSGTVVMKGTTFDDEPCEVRVPILEFPPLHISVHLPVPQVLSGEPLTVASLGSFVKSQLDPESRAMQRLLTKHSLKTIVVEADIQVEMFMRVLAKIGHAFAVGEYGLDGFTPTLLPIIDGKSEYLIQYIGAETPERVQSVEPLAISEIVHNGTSYLSVFISLHAFPQLPRYQVIAGTREA